MVSKKEEFEMLSRELLGKLNELSCIGELFFPFGYALDEEIEEKYFQKGEYLRTILIRDMMIIDNSFKKFKLLPTHDIMVTYIETQKDILAGWIKESVEIFETKVKDAEDKEKQLDEFKKTLRKIESDINKNSKTAIKEAASSDEAKMLDLENGSSGSFGDFIHNTITNLFK